MADRLRLIFMGTPDFSVPILAALAARHDILAVYTQPPRPAGRGKAPRPSPVQVFAENLALPHRCPQNFKSPETRAEFAALQADVAVVVAYGLILPQALLDAPRLGCLNIHASLLPRWRGAAPIHRAILSGDAETGICIMQMEAGLDTGPVLLRAQTPIGATETTQDLHDRLSQMGAELILEALDKRPNPVPQAPGETYAAKIDKAEARIDWTLSAVQIDRQIRGLSPFPGAWCLAGGERLKLLRSALAVGQGAPGQHLGGGVIACGQGAIRILQAQREGKRPTDLADLQRGFTLPDLA